TILRQVNSLYSFKWLAYSFYNLFPVIRMYFAWVKENYLSVGRNLTSKSKQEHWHVFDFVVINLATYNYYNSGLCRQYFLYIIQMIIYTRFVEILYSTYKRSE